MRFVADSEVSRLAACCALTTALLAAGTAPSTAFAGRARFSAPIEVDVGRYPFRVATADFNRDGRPDLATADNGSHTVSVALGRGDGSFRTRVRRYSTARETADVAAADVNADGRPDLIASSANRRGAVTVLINQGAGRFKRTRIYTTGAAAPAVAVADVNRDGRPDVLTANLGRRDLAVLINRGGGRFAAARRFAGAGGATDLDVGDLNGDGNADVVLATANWGKVVAIRLGDGTGNFGTETSMTAGRDPDGLTLVDLNRDGHLDLAVTNAESDTISVFLGAGDGTIGPSMTYHARGSPDAVVAGDFNLDGIPDLASSAGIWSPTVALGRGDGTFRAPYDLLWLFYEGAATADFNRDGRPDLAFVTATRYPNAFVFLNWTGRKAPPCVVLDVRADSLSVAEHAVREGGCRVGHIQRHFSPHVPKNEVISERPRRGTVLSSRSPVDLVVSRGRR